MNMSIYSGSLTFMVSIVVSYGVSPSRLKIHAVGSSEQKFPGAPLNRVVIIEDPTN